MKNEAMGAQASPPARPGTGREAASEGREGGARDAWGAALRRFDRELRRRGAAERTRRAYGTDVGELAGSAAGPGRGGAGGVGGGPWCCARRSRLPVAAPVGGARVPGRRRAEHARPQARLG